MIRAVFPGGTITGAPKIRTMEIIEELEPVRRGFYTGSFGWIGYNKDAELNISIRTMLAKDRADLLEGSEMARLRDELGLPDAAALHAWSIEDVGRFWQTAVWDRFEVLHDGSPDPALADASMPGARWFPNARLSFPEHCFRGKDDDALALQAAGEVREHETWTWGHLREETTRIRAGLRALGVGEGRDHGPGGVGIGEPPCGAQGVVLLVGLDG